MATPIHIQGTRKARKMTLAIWAGRKLGASPTVFIARDTHSSPPVPATTIRVNRMKSRTLVSLRNVLGRPWVCSADHEDPETDHRNARPAHRRDVFPEHEGTEQRHHPVSQRGD